MMKCLILLIMIFSFGYSYYDEIEEIKKSVVFIGFIDSDIKPQLVGTGFLVQIENTFNLVTAKHVIFDNNKNEFIDNDFAVFFNRKDNKVTTRYLKDIKNKYKVNWVFSENKLVDVAIIPFEINIMSDDVKVIPQNVFLTSDDIYEIYDVYFMSYQPGLEDFSRINPVLRSGTISLKNNDKTFYIDAFAFPGNSGSPVFLKPSPFRRGNVINFGRDTLGNSFIGIIGSYLPYREVAVSVQTNRPRVIFEENTGLSHVWSIEYINKIIESKKFKEQLDKIKPK